MKKKMYLDTDHNNVYTQASLLLCVTPLLPMGSHTKSFQIDLANDTTLYKTICEKKEKFMEFVFYGCELVLFKLLLTKSPNTTGQMNCVVI